MSRLMKKTFLILFILSTMVLVLFTTWVLRLNQQLNQRLSEDWFTPPVEFYYGGVQLHRGQKIGFSDFEQTLLNHGFRERSYTEPLQTKDFYEIPKTQCETEFYERELGEIFQCLRLRSDQEELFSIVWTETSVHFFKGEGLIATPSIYLEPKLLGEFQGGQPLKRRKVSLSEVPLVCLQAITAIEDSEFLSHSGVSPSGMARALIRNLLAGRFAQGGSTITQQLVKNYFLTHEKTLKRKVTEQILAVLLESKITKDQILEKYLNVIYMGQEGPYQIIGLGSGAHRYFAKPVSNLNLSDCAVLAALINNPGRFNPLKNPENAIKRKNLVLSKMFELDWISAEEKSFAENQSLPDREIQEPEPSAPYFLEVAYSELVSLGLSEEGGFKVLTSLSPRDQMALESGIHEELPKVRSRASGDQPVEVAAVRVHLDSSMITGLVGGSHFRTAPYNRALRAQRQIGSVIKPFIYWQAFGAHRPWDKIVDEPFTWKFDGREWTPRNYDRGYQGEVPLYLALVKSLNVPAAKLAQEVGIDTIRDTLFAAGFERPIESLPSVALGALEMSPIEVAQIFSTLGKMGRYKKLSAILRVDDFSGNSLYINDNHSEDARLDAHQTATLISTLTLSSSIGTAQRLKSNISNPDKIAGKTGTTNDLKDSWFVGIMPEHLMVVWTGRDDAGTTMLTGSSGALPIWGAIEKKIHRTIENDFDWPEDVKTEVVDSYPFKL